MGEVLKAQPERKRTIGINDPAEFVQEFRLAVGCQAHHLILVAEFPEANVLRQRGVIHSERMRKPDFPKCPHFRPFAQGPHGAGKVPQAIS